MFHVKREIDTHTELTDRRLCVAPGPDSLDTGRTRRARRRCNAHAFGISEARRRWRHVVELAAGGFVALERRGSPWVNLSPCSVALASSRSGRTWERIEARAAGLDLCSVAQRCRLMGPIIITRAGRPVVVMSPASPLLQFG